MGQPEQPAPATGSSIKRDKGASNSNELVASHSKADTNSASKCNTKKKKAGRRRRGKKDVILDFTKRAKSGPRIENGSLSNQSNGLDLDSKIHGAKSFQDQLSNTKQRLKKHSKLSLSTSSKDYAGNLGLPDKVVQREFESTGQFFRRLDRLVAKAKVEANLQVRFDIDQLKNQDKAKVKPSS